VQTVDRVILSFLEDSKTKFMRQDHTLIGGDIKKEQYSMRGQLDAIELVLNDAV
jgi:hypothetical protein